MEMLGISPVDCVIGCRTNTNNQHNLEFGNLEIAYESVGIKRRSEFIAWEHKIARLS